MLTAFLETIQRIVINFAKRFARQSQHGRALKRQREMFTESSWFHARQFALIQADGRNGSYRTKWAVRFVGRGRRRTRKRPAYECHLGGGREKYRRVRAEILAIDSSWLQNEPESCKSNHSAVTRRFIQVAGGSLLNRKMERSTG